jgi:zinc/manganese transport system substrate-binding protein
VKRAARRTFAAAALIALALALAGCGALGNQGGSAGQAPARAGVLHVVAAENFWGSIAAQLGGEKVQVASLISNPGADPHDYEPTVVDARTAATAEMVVFNGVGYDPWVQRLLRANPNPKRVEVEAGKVADVPVDGNPHLWYSPTVVRAMVRQIVKEYKTLDPANAAYYQRRSQDFERRLLAKYDALVSAIASNYAGTPIGASESIIVPLAEDLHLKVLTPRGYLTAVSAGVDPSAADKSAVDEQISTKQIKVFIYNRQNSSPDVMALVEAAKAAGVPVVTVTETPEPADASFQDWQAAQLQALAAALRKATGR